MKKNGDGLLNSHYILSETAIPLRTGITTGSCATAAAKAALMRLLHTGDTIIQAVDIELPDHRVMTVPIFRTIQSDQGIVTAIVIKDAGDDHDVTHGIEIQASVSLTNHAGEIEITGGEGVGRITKKGLQIPVGSYAINPIPLKMITENLKPWLPETKGALVTIGVPRGRELALKTFNPRLGIEGGLSIIGTTGIVRPMSEDAFKATIYAELKQKKAMGVQNVTLVPGQHGEKYAQNQCAIDPDGIVHVGNFVGFALSAAESLGYNAILLVGHIGKYIKLAGGIFNTHSKVADAKAHILITYMALEGASVAQMATIYASNTTDEMSEWLHQWGWTHVLQRIAMEAKRCCINHLETLKNVDVILYDMSGRRLGDTQEGVLT